MRPPMQGARNSFPLSRRNQEQAAKITATSVNLLGRTFNPSDYTTENFLLQLSSQLLQIVCLFLLQYSSIIMSIHTYDGR